MKKCLRIFICILFIACRPNNRLSIIDISPSQNKGECPNLHVSPFNNLYLTWIEQENDSTDILWYSKIELQAKVWSNPKIIAHGQDWFVNWADFPGISTFAGSELNILSHILKKNSSSTYDYFIQLLLSRDGGDRFQIIDSLHTNIPGEHGFVSMIPYSFDKVMTIWLDGGKIKEAHANPESKNDHAHHGSMQLMSAMVSLNRDLIQNRQIIDEKVCECCQTDITMTKTGPIVVYRNRSDNEERDIYYSKFTNGSWTSPQPIFEDHWKINGCPVNGPAIASIENKVAVVYYTEAPGVPTIKLAISENDGLTFLPPVTIATKNTLGRLDIIWKDVNNLLVSYLDKESKEAAHADLNLTMIDANGKVMITKKMGTLSAKRKSGFPILEKWNEDIILAYTDLLSDTLTQIKVQKLIYE